MDLKVSVKMWLIAKVGEENFTKVFTIGENGDYG